MSCSNTIWWCCDEKAWLPVTVQQRGQDKAGLLKAYLVRMQQEGCEDDDMELPHNQVRMHLPPGSRVRVQQAPPVAVGLAQRS